MEFDIWTIVSAVLGLVAIVAGGFYAKIKGKLGAIISLGKEAVDLAQVAVKSLDDNKITKEEIEQIKKEAGEVKAAWKVLTGK